MGDESGRIEGLDSSPSSHLVTFAEAADEQCSVYMAMGVSYHEYWQGDYTQLEHYRKAHEMKQKQANYNAWLQGSYVYDALCMVQPIFNPYAKGGTKPAPYHQLPYGEKAQVDAERVKEAFLEKWKADKAKWKEMNGISD